MVKKILTSLCGYLNLKNYKALALYCGVKETQVYSWLKHNKITDTGIILAKNPEINVEWLRTGKGPMVRCDKDSHPKTVDQKIVMTIEPGTARKKGSKAEEQKSRQDKEKISEGDRASHPDMLVMMSVVLASNTVYRPALASNITAFYQAVQGNTVVVEERDNISMTEMMIMTSTVLESRTIYRTALVSNLLAFNQAVQGEQEMSEMRDELALLREEIKELRKMVEASISQEDKKREAI